MSGQVDFATCGDSNKCVYWSTMTHLEGHHSGELTLANPDLAWNALLIHYCCNEDKVGFGVCVAVGERLLCITREHWLILAPLSRVWNIKKQTLFLCGLETQMQNKPWRHSWKYHKTILS